MGNHDLTFVAPDRRDEVQRRIAVIESFLKQPGPASAEAHAKLLGLQKSQFYTLAKAWKESKRPEALAGAGFPRSRRLSVSTEQAAFMDDVIAKCPTAPTREIVNLIIKQGSQRELPLRDVISRYVSHSRPRALPANLSGSAGLIIDYTVLDIPVRFDVGQPVRPIATIVIDTTLEAVVGLSLSNSVGPAPAARALLDAVRRGRRSAVSATSFQHRIVRPELPAIGWDWFDDILRVAGFDVEPRSVGAYEHGQLAEALMGRKFAGIGLRPRLVTATADRRLSKVTDARKWLTPEDAFRIVRGRLVGTRTTVAFSFITDVRRHILEQSLAAQADGYIPLR